MRMLREHAGNARGIGAVMIGTTHFTNAVVQRRDLAEVAAVRIGAPATTALPPFCDWPADLAALARAWAEPEAWTGMTRIASQDAPAEMVGITVADELVVHGWDMARATGQPYAAEPELVDAAGTFLGMFASPDAPAGPEVPFGPSRELPGGAPALDRVLALAGRDLSWPAG